ncbi:MAG TPA: biotin/lipoyl-containing protein [Chloroflexota bacterium]|nr:biotin/lipoyl-containing protein [Chloroflexota bacterium]
MATSRPPSAAGIRALADLCSRSGVEELHASHDTWSVRLRLDLQAGAIAGTQHPAEPLEATGGPATQVSQWVGVFHRAQEHDADALAIEGRPVREGDVVAVLVAMQLQHEIRAERDGILVRFLVADGAPVEYGQPLLELA